MSARPFRTALGVALVVGGFAFVIWAIFSLVDYGTCSSGYYATGRECAPDTGLKIVGIIASVFVVLTGVGLIGTWRGALTVWGITFCGFGAMFLFMAFAPDSGDLGVRIPFVFVGVVFQTMGLPGLWEGLRPRSAAEQRSTVIDSAYGTRLTVRAPQDGGPQPIVMADHAQRRRPTL